MSRDLAPPRLAVWLLRLALPRDRRDDIRTDLEEMLEEQAHIHGPGRARLWFWRETLSFCGRFLLARLGSLGVQVRRGERPFGPVSRRLPLSELDWKISLRALRKTPALSLLAVVALAVAVALTTTAFTVFDALYGGRLPFPDSEQIVRVGERHLRGGYEVNLDADAFHRLQRDAKSFNGLAAYYERRQTVGWMGETGAPATAAYVTPNLFELIGARASRGRTLEAQDLAAGEPAVVLGHDLWRSRFVADPDIVGRVVSIAGQPHRVIGVVLPGFAFPSNDDLWIAARVDPTAGGATERGLRVVGRLAPGVSREQAQAELRALALRESERQREIVSEPFVQSFTGAGATGYGVLAAVLGGLVLVVVVVAANVANLLVARNASRTSDLALRSALGASRTRLISQLLLESLVLGVAASLLGIIASRRAIAELVRIAGDEVPFWADLGMDGRVLGFVAAMTLLATAVAGLLPALASTRGLESRLPRASGTHSGGFRFRRVSATLVVVQVALSVGLLGGSAGLGRALFGFSYQDLGLPAEKILVGQIYFGQAPGAEKVEDSERAAVWRAFSAACLSKMERLRSRLESLPSVESATFASQLPGNERDTPTVFQLQHTDGHEQTSATQVVDVGPRFLETLAVEPLLGRAFFEHEVATSSREVALVNQPFAAAYLGDSPVLGARVRTGSPSSIDKAPWREIVGVIPDLGLGPADPGAAHGIYVPARPVNIFRLALRTSGAPGELQPELHSELATIDPRADVQWTVSLAEQMALPERIFRALALGLLGTGAIALILSAASLYAILSLSVTRRIPEIGVRRALGAGSFDVARSVLGRGVTQLAIGGGAGAALGLLVSRALPAAVPFAIRAEGLWLTVAVALLLAGLGATGCLHPLHRALELQPQDALRQE